MSGSFKALKYSLLRCAKKKCLNLFTIYPQSVSQSILEPPLQDLKLGTSWCLLITPVAEICISSKETGDEVLTLGIKSSPSPKSKHQQFQPHASHRHRNSRAPPRRWRASASLQTARIKQSLSVGLMTPSQLTLFVCVQKAGRQRKRKMDHDSLQVTFACKGCFMFLFGVDSSL